MESIDNIEKDMKVADENESEKEDVSALESLLVAVKSVTETCENMVEVIGALKMKESAESSTSNTDEETETETEIVDTVADSDGGKKE